MQPVPPERPHQGPAGPYHPVDRDPRTRPQPWRLDHPALCRGGPVTAVYDLFADLRRQMSLRFDASQI